MTTLPPQNELESGWTTLKGDGKRKEEFPESTIRGFLVLSCDLALPLATFLPKSPEDCWVVVMSKTKKWDVFLEKGKTECNLKDGFQVSN